MTVVIRRMPSKNSHKHFNLTSFDFSLTLLEFLFNPKMYKLNCYVQKLINSCDLSWCKLINKWSKSLLSMVYLMVVSIYLIL